MCDLLGLCFNKQVDPKFSMKAFGQRGRGNNDGWGIAFYTNLGLIIKKDYHPAYDEQKTNHLSEYFEQVIQNSYLKSKIFIGHVRKGSEPCYANTHPFFQFYNGKEWAFAHNGTIDKNILRIKINENKDQAIIKSKIQNQEFTSTDESMTENDWILVQNLLNLMERLFGGYTIKKMMTGTMFINEWGVRFTVASWQQIHKIYNELGVSLPHNKFVGIVSGFPSTSSAPLTIQRFIIDSLVSPWRIKGRLMIQGIPCENYYPIFKLPININHYSIFYNYLSENMFENYLDWKNEDSALEKNQVYAKLGNVLVDLLKKQIYRQYLWKFYVKDPDIIYDLTKSDILLYQKLAIQCLYDCLYDTKQARDVRLQLYEFLTSEGKKEVILDFSSGRFNKIFGENNPLEKYDGFYKLKLQWEDFQSFFGENWAKMANSIPLALDIPSFLKYSKGPVSTRFLPQNIIGRERIIKIAEFLRYIAEQHSQGRPIRIYGFQVNHNGFGNGYGTTKIYFPKQDSPIIDDKMPGSNQWYYEIDPNNLDKFNLEDFRIFLRALFADHQGFFVRREGMLKGEFLFAFDASGTLHKEDIVIPKDTNYYRPTTPSIPLEFIDSIAYSDLEKYWEVIVKEWNDDLMILQCHRYVDINNWHNFLKLMVELNERSSSFNSLGED